MLSAYHAPKFRNDSFVCSSCSSSGEFGRMCSNTLGYNVHNLLESKRHCVRPCAQCRQSKVRSGQIETDCLVQRKKSQRTPVRSVMWWLMHMKHQGPVTYVEIAADVLAWEFIAEPSAAVPWLVLVGGPVGCGFGFVARFAAEPPCPTVALLSIALLIASAVAEAAAVVAPVPVTSCLIFLPTYQRDASIYLHTHEHYLRPRTAPVAACLPFRAVVTRERLQIPVSSTEQLHGRYLA